MSLFSNNCSTSINRRLIDDGAKLVSLLAALMLWPILLLGQPVWAAKFDVYLATGQSNLLGTTSFEGFRPDRFGPPAHPADSETAFFWSNVSAANDRFPPILYGDSDGVITALQMQQGDGGANPAFWGPEFGFARTMYDAGERNVLIVKVARGGGGNTWWDASTFEDNNNAGHMWGHLRDSIDLVLSKLVSDGHTFQVNGLIYLQGESNNRMEAQLAGSRLGALASNLESHINFSYNDAAVGMKTMIGEIAASRSTGNRRVTNTQQFILASRNDDVSFVATDDLRLKQDAIHFGRDAKLLIGQRFADAMLTHLRPCDYNADGVLDIHDLDLLVAEIKSGESDLLFDVTRDGALSMEDIVRYVQDPAKLNTWVGDTNLDGEFNSRDLVELFRLGEFEDEVAMNSTWSSGDFTGDGEFGTEDLVAAFQSGGYELGPRSAVLVPEPASTITGWLGLVCVMRRHRNTRSRPTRG